MRTHVPGGRRLLATIAAPASLLTLLAASSVAAQGAPEGEQLFTQRCASCHNIGDGPKVGPDLLGVLDRRNEAWVKQFLKSPGAMIAGGDPTATELFQKFNVQMPDQQLSDDERKGLFAFFKECTRKGGCKPGSDAREAGDATPEEIEHGRQLFEGQAALYHGGPACIGCHNTRDVGVAGGGTLARDLTFAYARMGERKLNPALAEMPWPLMKELYAKAPLTSAERFELKAYLAQLSRDGTPPQRDRDFFYLGFVGMFVALGFIGIVLGGHGHAKDGEGDDT